MNTILNRFSLIPFIRVYLVGIYLIVTGLLLWLTPAEKTLGSIIKVVFFHVALSHASLYAFYLSAFAGVITIFLIYKNNDSESAHLANLWSLYIGRVSLFVWAISVIISLWAMELAWGQIDLQEPLTVFVIIVLVLGIGKELVISGARALYVSLANILFAIIITVTRPHIGRIMHPENPIGSSEVSIFKIMSTGLIFVTLITILLYSIVLIYRNSNR